jgi:hypothetical protein
MKKGVLLPTETPERLWGPPNPYPVGIKASFTGVKRPVREVDHSLPSIAEVKNGGAISLLHKSFRVIVLN